MAFQVETSLLNVRIVLEGWPFGPKLFISFLSKERIVAQKCSRKIGNFGQHAPRHQSKMISKHRGLGTCDFGHRGGFDRLEVVASLEAYEITNYQFLSKTHHSLLPDFRRIREISF